MKSFRYKLNRLRTFSQKANEVAFLLGGIGTGNFSVGARGQFQDWEIFNKPGKGNIFPYTFFAIHVNDGQRKYSRVLEAEIQTAFAKSHGFASNEVAGLPRFKTSVFRGEYPLCQIDLIDDTLPVSVSMEVFTPFIPLDAEASSYPAAVVRYFVKNESNKELFVSVAGSIANMTTFSHYNQYGYVQYAGETENLIVQHNRINGILMKSTGFSKDNLYNRSIALTTSNRHFTIKPVWFQGKRYLDGAQDFWNDFMESGRLIHTSEEAGYINTKMNQTGQKICSLAPYENIGAHEQKAFEFIISWHVPNRLSSWSQECSGDCEVSIIKNFYACKFADAFDVAKQLYSNLRDLETNTLKFHEALFQSTLPNYVLDALASNITVIRSTTCFRVEGGQFYGWEGCFNDAGCCDGNCTHVWNYEQTLAFLFPELSQSMRMNEFKFETAEDGKMNFRSRKQLNDPDWDFPAAVDGQNGTIVRLYRDWKISGKDSLIYEYGDIALKALDYAYKTWDSDHDGVLDNEQHNTYDIEFYGPNSLANSMYIAALLAGVKIAEFLGQIERAKKYQEKALNASKLMDELLWGGEFYIQKIDDINAYRYQYGTGCLSDQIIGQFMSHVCNLGYVLPEEHIKRAIYSVYKYNFKRNFQEHHSVQRTYALNDESGLLLCSWPHGGRPRLPFIYADEVWTGIEYQVAATLIYEGYVDEGLEIVEAVRDRYDGYKRNPFNEVECGNHYVRSLASWALLLSLSGYQYDLSLDKVSFNPRINKDAFSCFFSNGRQWGIYKQNILPDGGKESSFEVLYQL